MKDQSLKEHEQGLSSRGSEIGAPTSPGAKLWLALMAFWISASVVFALAAEWNSYCYCAGLDSVSLGAMDRLLVFWLLVSKSLILLVPAALAASVALALNCRTLAKLAGLGLWLVTFYWLAVDVVSVQVVGRHISEFIPYFIDTSGGLSANTAQWAGDGLVLDLLTILAVVAAGGLPLYFLSRWVSARIVDRFAGRSLWKVTVAGAFLLALLMFGGAVASVEFTDQAAMRRLYNSFPIYPSVLERLSGGWKDRILCYIAGVAHAAQPGPSSAAKAGDGKNVRSAGLINATAIHVDLSGWALQTPAAGRIPLSGDWPAGELIQVSLPGSVAPGERLLLLDNEGSLRGGLVAEARSPDMVLTWKEEDRTRFGRIGFNVREQEARLADLFSSDPKVPKPIDRSAYVVRDSLPNVLCIALESFRHNAVSPRLMARLDAFSRRGFRAERHYSGSFCSHLGLFSLLYGRAAFPYKETLEAGLAPQLCESLRLSGYRRTFLTSGECVGFQDMEKFLGRRGFDEVIVGGGGNPKDYAGSAESWPHQDVWKLRQAGRMLSQKTPSPQFVFLFLMSGHYPYVFPPGFEIYKPCAGQGLLSHWTKHWVRASSGEGQDGFAIARDTNRYNNAMLFLESEIMKLLDSLDLTRTLVIITGDHGESMGEDKVWLHSGRPSDIQTRVPFIMVGAGVKPSATREITWHADLTPTLLGILNRGPLPVANSHGRDLLHDSAGYSQPVFAMCDKESLTVLDRGTRLLFDWISDGEAPRSMRFVGFLNSIGERVDAPLEEERDRDGKGDHTVGLRKTHRRATPDAYSYDNEEHRRRRMR